MMNNNLSTVRVQIQILNNTGKQLKKRKNVQMLQSL